jgi:hypothetical protein
MIKFIDDKALIDCVSDYDVILVGTNCYQSMRNGFQLEIAKKFPYVKSMNNATKYGDIDKLGTILECKKDNNPLITLLFISFGYNFKGNDSEYVDYEALSKCLQLINLLYKGKRVATTLLGSTFFDGNGNKDKIIEIFKEKVNKVDVDIYTYPQKSYEEMKKEEYFSRKNKKVEKIFGINENNYYLCNRK